MLDLGYWILDTERWRLDEYHISNIVYSANGSCVDTTICNGRILMRAKKVKGEEKVMEQAQDAALNLVKRSK